MADEKALMDEQTTDLSRRDFVALTAAGLPTAPIWDIAQAADNEHTQARGLVSQLPHATLGMAPSVGQPVRFDGEKPVAATSAPQLGGDLAAVRLDGGHREAEARGDVLGGVALGEELEHTLGVADRHVCLLAGAFPRRGAEFLHAGVRRSGWIRCVVHSCMVANLRAKLGSHPALLPARGLSVVGFFDLD